MFFGFYELKANLLLSYVVSSKMALTFNMFGSSLKDWVFGHLYTALIVTVDGDGVSYRKAHIFKDIAVPHGFFRDFCYCAVLNLGARLGDFILEGALP